MIIGLLLSLLNVGMVVAPIGGAVGVLAGIDYQRKVNGQLPLFWSPEGTPGDGYTGGDGAGSFGGGGSGGGNSTPYVWPGNKPNKTTVKGGVTIKEYCQQYNAVQVNTTTGQNYTVNPNQWGWSAKSGGGMCLNVTTNNNMTYATNTTAPHWSAEWQYPSDDGQPVHAYPNIMLQGTLLPVKLGKLSTMQVDVVWAYLDAGVSVNVKPTPVAPTSPTATAAPTKGTATGTTSPAGTNTKAAAAADSDTTPTPTGTTAPAAAEKSETTKAAATPPTATTPAAVTPPTSTAKATEAKDKKETTTAAASGKDKDAKARRAEAIARRAERRREHQKRWVGGVSFSANVAVDMFFDADAKMAGKTSTATYEVMVWFAQFGEYTDPIGYSDGVIATQIVSGVNFTLFYGANSNKQHVLTWVAEDAAATFSGSILPLITILPSLKVPFAPAATDYLGYFAFGSEAYYSTSKVTFDVQKLSMDLW